MAKRKSKAYRFRLRGSSSWTVFVCSARNKKDAERALLAMFGGELEEVRTHPLCDPFPTPEKRRRVALPHTINR